MIFILAVLLAFVEPTHYCAAACLGPCLHGQPCECDGITCDIRIQCPDGHMERGLILIENLPKRRRPCPDRPLSQGRTFKRIGSGHGLYLICNSPHCLFCGDRNRD